MPYEWRVQRIGVVPQPQSREKLEQVGTALRGGAITPLQTGRGMALRFVRLSQDSPPGNLAPRFSWFESCSLARPAMRG